MLQHQHQQQQLYKLPVMEAENGITKKISFFKTKLSKFLRIFILIMQQATTSINCSGSNINCTRMITQIIVQMKVKKTATKKKKTDAIQCDDKDINQNNQAYKDANEDNGSNVDINIIGDEMSHQQLNYDKVSTITSTLSRCQRQKHHQIKATPSSSSTSSLPLPLITTSVVQGNYETCQWSAILRHYIHDDDNLQKPQYHRHHHHHRRHLHAMHIKSAPSSTTAATTTTTSSAASASICQSVDQYVNASWNRSYTMSCLLLTLFIAFTIGVRSTTAGACWQTVLDNGKCNEIFSLNISKSECCGANQEFAYTDREPTNVEYFFATAIGGGMECSPCLESCKNVKCGPNKKCVKRKGRPKCICAPECGAARRRRKQREHIMQQQQQQQHHKLLIDISDANGGVDGAALRDATAISTPNAFKIKLEKSQQSRDIRSLSSEITNINLGLENSKDVDNGRGLTSPMDRHHQHKEHNNHQSQRKLIHIHMQQQQQQQQQQYKSKHKQSNNNQQYTHRQQQQHQPKHKTQEPKGNPRLLITANVEHTEKPTTRRLQIFSNVRTTHARRHNNNSNRNNGNNNNHGQDTDPSDNDEEDYEENYNDEDDGEDDGGGEDEETKKSTTTTNNNNNRNDDATRFSNQSLSRHKLKTKTKPNSNNNNTSSSNSNSNIKKKNTNYHDLQITKIQQQQQHSSNNTRIRHPNQNGRHAENSPHHRRHHHHHHHNHQQQQQTHHNQQQQQEQQNYGRRKHNKQHHKHQKNNKDYDNNSNNNTMTTTIVGSSTGTSNTLHNSTKIGAAAATKTTATGELSTVTKTTVLNLSSPLSTEPTSSSSSSLIVSNATPDIQTQHQKLSSLNTPVNSTMSAADHRQHHHLYPSSSQDLANHGSEIATSSSLPSSSTTTTSLLSATSARSASESTLTVTTMSAKGEGVSIHRHHQDLNEITTSSSNNAKTYTALNPHSTHQQQHQTQQHQQHYQTALFDGILDQFDLHGFPNKQHTITNAENVRSTNPVCGTDGRTYNTECQLRKRACRTDNSNLLIAYRGHCKTTCNGVKCLNGLTCVEDQYSMPHCIACKIECPQDDCDNDVVDATRAVCGADGKTYKSTCDINRMICKIGRSIGVAYPGPCREDQVTCDDINCGPKHVCLIDLLTHKPRCTSCRYKCSRKRRPSHLRYEEGKICGVNNRTYNSWCEMRKDSCSTGFYIDVKYSGDCH